MANCGAGPGGLDGQPLTASRLYGTIRSGSVQELEVLLIYNLLPNWVTKSPKVPSNCYELILRVAVWKNSHADTKAPNESKEVLKQS